MGIAIAIGLSIVAVLSVGYGMYTVSQMKGITPTVTNMQPNSVDSFQVTKVTEGIVVPAIYGRVRVSGNILWYGNLVAIENYSSQTSEVQDGKSTKTVVQSYISSYTYFLSVWQLLCEGPATLISTWVNDNLQSLPGNTPEVFASGVDNPSTVSPPNSYIKSLEGICWIYMHSLRLGVNSTSVQTLHFLVESLPTIPFIGGDRYCTTGINPSYLVYCLLIKAGATTSQMNLPSFIAASGYWGRKNYGLNISLTAQAPLREQIKYVLSFVGGYFGVDSENKFRLKAFDGAEEAVANLVKEDFIDFQFSRKSWQDTHNTFTGNLIDETMSHTKRTVSITNVSNVEIQGLVKPMSVDLSAFRDRTLAEQRLWEIMKENSYPASTVSYSTFLDKAFLEIGDVVTIAHEDLGMTATYYRIISKGMGEIDDNKLTWVAAQVVERLFDDNFVITSGSTWIEPDHNPVASSVARIFEWPLTYDYSNSYPCWIILATKGGSGEIGVEVLTSSTIDGGYISQGVFPNYSRYSTLYDTYPITNVIDDSETGMIVTPTVLAAAFPEFSDVSRTDLFALQNSRLLLVDDEIMTYQTATPVYTGSYRLQGVIRGLYGTVVTSHGAGASVWLFQLNGTTWHSGAATSFYTKLYPSTATMKYTLGAAIHVTGVNKAAKPWPVPNVKVTRTNGDRLLAEWWPVTKTYDGAGFSDPGDVSDPNWALSDMYPMLYDGCFMYSTDGVTWYVVPDPGVTPITGIFDPFVSFILGGAFNFYLRNAVNGVCSDVTTVAVGAPDGVYKN